MKTLVNKSQMGRRLDLPPETLANKLRELQLAPFAQDQQGRCYWTVEQLETMARRLGSRVRIEV